MKLGKSFAVESWRRHRQVMEGDRDLYGSFAQLECPPECKTGKGVSKKEGTFADGVHYVYESSETWCQVVSSS